MQVARDYAGMRALLIGCGSIGRRHGEVLLGLGVNDLAACDPEQAQRERMRELLPTIRLYGDYESALAEEKPDAAFVLTPTATHMAVAKAALLAGCHVFIEKPLANVSDGAQELVALARERGRNVMVGFCFRYHEALLRAKGMLEGGAIGRLVSIRALMGEHFPEVQPNYRNMYYARYSGAFELAHDLDLALWFANDQVE